MFGINLKVAEVSCLLALGISVSACSVADDLRSVGKRPTLSAIESPTSHRGYKPVQMPMPEAQAAAYAPNSLWRQGSRTFFKDQRAARIGDILTVNVTISDKANFANTSDVSRSSNQSAGAGGVVGNAITEYLPLTDGLDVSAALDTKSNAQSNGTGSINRSETLETRIAAVVTQVLPNGNLVIEGKQEIRVNHEVRELIIAGLVRPEDISAQNTVDSNKIAEARISYGGRGLISAVQSPKYGHQILEAITPF